MVKNIASDATEQVVTHIRELNEELISSSKSVGLTALESYEYALKSMLDFEQKVAAASPIEWVSTFAETHAKFVQDIAGAYTKAAKHVLK
jgi:hypothetical protein